ncbi:hypothetical protein K438DRAFT_2164857 [Mycena galopus ATCC 62051]|nr:hypothetical protein K438DRAFT_2164857 [Mycena galopus ATCC 62051]
MARHTCTDLTHSRLRQAQAVCPHWRGRPACYTSARPSMCAAAGVPPPDADLARYARAGAVAAPIPALIQTSRRQMMGTEPLGEAAGKGEGGGELEGRVGIGTGINCMVHCGGVDACSVCRGEGERGGSDLVSAESEPIAMVGEEGRMRDMCCYALHGNPEKGMERIQEVMYAMELGREGQRVGAEGCECNGGTAPWCQLRTRECGISIAVAMHIGPRNVVVGKETRPAYRDIARPARIFELAPALNVHQLCVIALTSARGSACHLFELELLAFRDLAPSKYTLFGDSAAYNTSRGYFFVNGGTYTGF